MILNSWYNENVSPHALSVRVKSCLDTHPHPKILFKWVHTGAGRLSKKTRASPSKPRYPDLLCRRDAAGDGTSDRRPTLKRALLKAPTVSLLLLTVLFTSRPGSGQTSTARVVVNKNPNPGRPVGSPSPPFLPVVSQGPADAAFTLVADYLARRLYEGPSSAASGLISRLRAEGYRAELATDLDRVFFNGYRFESETGVATPSIPTGDQPTGTRGLYILILRGYPKPEWLSDLTSKQIRLVEAFPPAAYLAWAARDVVQSLPQTVSYLRRAIAVVPGVRKTLFTPARSPSPRRSVAISAVEPSPQDSIRPYLESVTSDAKEVSRKNGRVQYVASLADIDIDALTHFETVYTITPLGEPKPSDERQAVLVLQPSINMTTGALELPAGNPNYGALLRDK